MKKAPKLTNEERLEIQILKDKGYSNREVAKVLGRSPNTVSSEIKRNSCGSDERTPVSDQGRYIAIRAKQKAYARRKYAKFQGKKIEDNNELRSFIISKLKLDWIPDEISGNMKANLSLGFYISKTAIYEWLRSARGQQYCNYLHTKRRRVKRRRKNKTERVMIPDRTSVHERPQAAMDRQEIGHMEFDSMLSSKRSGSKHSLAVLQDRTTRLVRAKLVTNLKPKPYANTITELSYGLNIESFTTDNGIENRSHMDITKKTGLPVFFTDPYASYQKGGVENVNKMLRYYFPKGTDFSKVRQTDVVNALTRINNKPRKILGYKSALQVAKEKGLIKSGVS